MAGAALFHGNGLAEHLLGTGLAQGLDQEGQILSGCVIDLGLLLQHDFLDLRSLAKGLLGQGLLGSRCQGEAQQVGPIQLAATQANADAGGDVAWRHPKAIGPTSHERQPGRGGEFGGGEALRARQFNPTLAGDLEHGGRGQGQGAVGRGHRSMAARGRTADQLAHPEMEQARTNPHHIHEGIHGTHLMEMHLLGRHPMDNRLGFRQQAEHLQHLGLKGTIQGGRQDLLPQITPMAMGRGDLAKLHLQVQPPQTTTPALVHHQPIGMAQAQGREGGIDHLLGQAQIEQGRQQHVARQAGGAIDQGQLAHGFGGLIALAGGPPAATAPPPPPGRPGAV